MPNSVKFALLIMVVTVIYGEILESRRELRSVPPLRRPPPEAAPPKLPDMMPEGRGRLRRPSLQDPAITIVADGKNTHSVSTGTAFSIDDNGVWITARHVTDGCDKLFVLVNSRGGYKVDFVSQHPTADVSLLTLAACLAGSVNIWDIVIWGIVILVIQILAFFFASLVIDNLKDRIEQGEVGPAILLFSGKVSVGLLNAAAISG